MAIPEGAAPRLPDYREPGQRMQPLNLKVPPQHKRRLKELAEQMNTDPTTLARHLLIRSLEMETPRQAA